MSSSIHDRLGKRIASKRGSTGMTQEELAKRTGLTLMQLCAYEDATAAIPASHLWFIAVAQDVPMIYYFSDDEEAKDD